MVRAVHCPSFGLENLQLTELDAAAPRENEVVVAVKAVSLNYRDYMTVTGAYNPRQPLPLIPCSDGSGVVEAVGSNVVDLAPGDRVCSTMIPDWEAGRPDFSIRKTTLGGPIDGLLAERRSLPANALLKIPDYLDFEEAACLPVAGLTAWSALVSECKIGKGSKVLLLGTGGVSMMALGIAKSLGATVAITSSRDEKLARAKQLGADHIVNYRDQPAWADQVLKIFPAGADCVLEVGGEGTFDQSVKATAMGGRIALIGVLATQKKAVNLVPVFMKRLRVQGILVGSRTEFRSYLDHLERHELRPVIGARFVGLERAAEAFALMASGDHFGKIVLRI